MKLQVNIEITEEDSHELQSIGFSLGADGKMDNPRRGYSQTERKAILRQAVSLLVARAIQERKGVMR